MGIKTKILIIGAGGYIGSISTYLFLKNGFSVVAVDNFSKGYRTSLELLEGKFDKSLRVYEADLKDDLSSVFEKEKEIRTVVHYAALCSPEESVKKPKEYFENNVLGTRNLVEEMQKHGVDKIVFSSTCAVYGEPSAVPVDEGHPTRPLTPYAETKLLAEKEIKKSGLRYSILRYFNVCGAERNGFLGDSKKPCETLVQRAVRGALGIEPFFLTCPQVATPDKTPIRDYIDVLDLAEAHILGVRYLLAGGKNDILNLGTGSGYSVLEVVKAVEKATDIKITLKKGKVRPWEFAKITASYEKAQRILGWWPKRTLEDSINSLILWYKQHPKGWTS